MEHSRRSTEPSPSSWILPSARTDGTSSRRHLSTVGRDPSGGPCRSLVREQPKCNVEGSSAYPTRSATRWWRSRCGNCPSGVLSQGRSSCDLEPPDVGGNSAGNGDELTMLRRWRKAWGISLAEECSAEPPSVYGVSLRRRIQARIYSGESRRRRSGIHIQQD